jgi:phosphotransferase system enzyme I (PtsI)
MVGRPDLDASLQDAAVGTPQQRIEQVLAALEAVATQLESRAAHTDAGAAVLKAQAMLARDTALAAAIKTSVEGGASARQAIAASFGKFRSALEAAGPYMAERVADLDDVRDRAVGELLGLPMPGIPDPGHPFVLVSADLSPADTALLDPATVLAIVTEYGGPTSHTAILAKSLGIPAVVAVAGAAALTDGETVLVDGATGSVQRSPEPETVRAAMARYQATAEQDRAATGPGRTADGTPVKLLVNIGADRDLEVAAAADAEGIGLFRTEFLFLDRAEAPNVEEQIACYRKVFDAFTGRRVVVRTLDAGADKPLRFITHAEEPNPALGVRGLRTTRLVPALLDDQLRAIAAASEQSDAEVWVMAPMVSVQSEARAFAASARAQGVRVVGSMIEVPAAALRARSVLSECDFVSLGTNDLAQYTFAADRMLGELGDLLDPWQPGLLELVRITAQAGRDAGKPVGVCGEAASDPLLALVLVGLGVQSLSMAPSALPAVRTALRNHTDAQCAEMAERALRAEDPAEARRAAQEQSARVCISKSRGE